MEGLSEDVNVNSDKLGATIQKRSENLVKIINTIGNLQLGNNNIIDVFGDAYELKK
jgi:type I restriction enzyme M protein